MSSEELLNIAVEATENKKAEDVISLNMQGISDMTDYFVVCHGNNERQVQSIARAVKEAVHEQGIDVKRMEGYNDARWVLIDLANVVLPTPGGPIKVRIGILLTASFVEDPSLLINNLVSKKHSLSPFIGK